MGRSDDYSKIVSSLLSLLESNLNLWEQSKRVEQKEVRSEVKPSSEASMFDGFKNALSGLVKKVMEPETIKDLRQILKGEKRVKLKNDMENSGFRRFILHDISAQLNDEEKLIHFAKYLFTSKKIEKISQGEDYLLITRKGDMLSSKHFELDEISAIELPRTRLYAALLTAFLPLVFRELLDKGVISKAELEKDQELEIFKGTEISEKFMLRFETAIKTLDPNWKPGNAKLSFVNSPRSGDKEPKAILSL